MLEDGITRMLERWIPIAVFANLLAALAASFFHWPDGPVYVLLGVTVLASIVAAVSFIGSVRGVRSAEDLGFRRRRDWHSYYMSYRGVRPLVKVLILAAFGVFLLAGMGTPPSMLAFFSLPLVGIFQAVTRVYPVDRR